MALVAVRETAIILVMDSSSTATALDVQQSTATHTDGLLMLFHCTRYMSYFAESFMIASFLPPLQSE